MTNEEAKTILLGLSDNPLVVSEYLLEALDIAIKALEQTELNPSYNSIKPELDCISREAVMKCYKKWQPYMATRIWDYEQELSKLPSVTPKAEWIPCSERLPEDESKLFIVTVNINNVKYVYHELVGCDGETWHIGGMGEELPFDVVAYMPLPQTYTESEDEE